MKSKIFYVDYRHQHPASLFPALQSAGYMTGGFGKIINGQGKTFAPKNDTSKVSHESDFIIISTIGEI